MKKNKITFNIRNGTTINIPCGHHYDYGKDKWMLMQNKNNPDIYGYIRWSDIEEIKKGGKSKKKKLTRKHRGIIQTGGNKGKLKKGYRYSGKKLKSGLPQIVKGQSKKC